MNFTTGELLMYGGAVSFALLSVLLIVMLCNFKRSRKKLSKLIEKEIDEQ